MPDQTSRYNTAVLTTFAANVDNRLGPISGSDADRVAILLRDAAAEIDRLTSDLKTANEKIAPFARFITNLDGRDDDEITSVEIECSQEETAAMKQSAIEAGIPEHAFRDGPSYLSVSLDGLKVKHWRALKGPAS